MADIRIEGLTKHYGDFTAVNDVTLEIRDGEFFTLLGPSGCGKSTLLAMLAGLVEPDSGQLTIGDRTVSDKAKRIFVMPEKRDCGLVFQSYALWPHMNVTENLRYGLKLKKVPRDEQRARILKTLELVGLEKQAERYPHELSGGQQQRAALARTIVAEPKVLLLDEPLSNLDAKLRSQARTWLREIHSETALTTVYVTHDQEEALSLSNRIAVMDSGRIQQIDDPESLYQCPASKQVAEFIGTTHFIDGAVISSDGPQLTIALDGRTPGDNGGPALSIKVCDGLRPPEGRVTIALRPEQLELIDATSVERRSDLPCRVLSVAYLGGRYLYRVAAGASDLEVHSYRRISKDDCVIRITAEELPVYAVSGTRNVKS